MENFKKIIENYEIEKIEGVYLEKHGNIPILLTAPHTMRQLKDDYTIKASEPYTKAIVKYITEISKCSYLIKQIDVEMDSNKLETDYFKIKLLDFIKNNNIKLVLDIHGASEERHFDVELGTLNNLSADFSTINELKEAFVENGIVNVEINNPFKGGGITQFVYDNTNIDVIQIEINRKYRNINKSENIKKICNCLIEFIKQYSKYL